MTDFDPDFATITDYAKYYRQIGLQVIPSKLPDEDKAWKRPAIPWREYSTSLTTDDLFQSWYGPKSPYALKNIGFITGVNSYFVVDADTHKNPEAEKWLTGLIAIHNNGFQLETATQRTGGGGLQYIFKAPPGWIPPTAKTPIGIDIRGQGGFAVLPPSRHESGNLYQWIIGKEPWEAGIATAPDWLTQAIDRLVGQHAPQGQQKIEHTPTPQRAITPFGMIIDGREDYMTRLIWRKVVALYRESPIPAQSVFQDGMKEAFGEYEAAVASRIREPGTPKHILLERENRGVTLFQQKWKYATDQWTTRVKEAASQQPREEPQQPPFDPETGEILEPPPDIYETLSPQDIYNLPDPEWLIDGLIIDQGLGFIFGAPGCGKSFIALNMALSIATKQPQWWDRDIIKSGAIIYISSEGVGDIKFRLRAWETATGIKTEAQPFYLIRQSINFMNAADTDRLLRTVQYVSTTYDTPIAAVFVDTVSRVLPGADENLQKDMTLFIKACDQVRESFQATVIGIHHTARAGNMRGSSVFDGAGDFLLEIQREQGEEYGNIVAKKIKAAQDGWTQPFRLKRVPTGDLKGTESLYAEPATQEARTHSWPSKTICQEILAAIDAAWLRRAPWSPHAQAKAEGNYAIERIATKWRLHEHLAKRIITTWQDNAVISYELIDAHSKRKGLMVKNGLNGQWFAPEE